MSTDVTITECPRDSFQGLAKFIPTDDKTAYMNRLVGAGFRRLDFGSFVSPKAVPQMADTAAVFENLDHRDDLYLIGIIGNMRGLEGLLACNGKLRGRGRIAGAGYPLSVSETFQQRNLGRTHEQSWSELEPIAARAADHGVDMIVYLSMAFGNPYDDPWSADVVVDFARRLAAMGVGVISLADTIGNARSEQIGPLFRAVREACPGVTLTAHFHSRPEDQAAKIDAALDAGCRMFDSALAGIGGCPFAKDELTGNMDTLPLIHQLTRRGMGCGLDPAKLLPCADEARRIAGLYGA